MVVLHQLSRKHYTALGPIRRSAILLATALIVLHGCSTPNQTVRHEPRSRHGDPPSFTRFWASVIVSWRHHRLCPERPRRVSWYGKTCHGRRTSSGEIYDMYGMTAAHKTLSLPSYVEVRNLENEPLLSESTIGDRSTRDGLSICRTPRPKK